jgi:hypothetical protein
MVENGEEGEEEAKKDRLFIECIPLALCVSLVASSQTG